jgi:hypothetical protein
VSFENITSHHFKTIVTLYLFVLSHFRFILFVGGDFFKKKLFLKIK